MFGCVGRHDVKSPCSIKKLSIGTLRVYACTRPSVKTDISDFIIYSRQEHDKHQMVAVVGSTFRVRFDQKAMQSRSAIKVKLHGEQQGGKKKKNDTSPQINQRNASILRSAAQDFRLSKHPAGERRAERRTTLILCMYACAQNSHFRTPGTIGVTERVEPLVSMTS